MTPSPSTVSTALALRLVVAGGTTMPVRAVLRYDIADPYAVQASFHTGSGAEADIVEWTFARQLLTDGVGGATGEGDVRVWPSSHAGEPVAFLSLSSPSGRAVFEVPLADLEAFLVMSCEVVPTGAESNFVDVEAELALLIWARPET